MLHGNFLSFRYHTILLMVLFCVPFMQTVVSRRDSDNVWYRSNMVHTMLLRYHTSSEIVSDLTNWEVKNCFQTIITLESLIIMNFIFFQSRYKGWYLMNQYPKAGNLIDESPISSLAGKCFMETQLELLIEKLFIADMEDHTITGNRCGTWMK